MQQPSVSDYFKIKKRIRDEPPNTKAWKLLAVSTSSEVAGGRDKPNPIRASSDTLSSPNPEPITINSRPAEPYSSSLDVERKTAKGKRRVPCYQKYHHLISTPNQQDVEMAPTPTNESPIPISANGKSDAYDATNLPLPYKYKELSELFRALETVSSIFFNRNELITLEKVKPAVLELVRTTQLREKHLAQFLTIFPNCYKLTQEKVKAPGSREASYQLVITPNLAASSSSVSAPSAGQMNCALITERREVFHNALLDLCFKYHKEFLLSLNPPMVVPADKQVTRWHPKFPLNQIPNIGLSEIPKAPEVYSISTSTAKEVIARAQNIMEAANPRMRTALAELMKKTAGGSLGSGLPSAQVSPAPVDASEKRAATKSAILKAQQALLTRANGNPAMREALNKILLRNKNMGSVSVRDDDAANKVLAQPPPPPPSVSAATRVEEKGNPSNNKKSIAALKGVSQSLIDKIRAREQEKAIRSMTLSPEETKRRAMLNRLPEFVKIVRNTMVAEKKSAMALHLVVERLSHSHYRSLSDTEVEGHVRFLHKTVPDWLAILKTTQGDFVKINKDVNINDIVLKIEDTINKTK